MKWLLLVFAFTFLSTNAMAEWTAVITGKNDRGAIYYFDYSTIRKASNRVKVWELIDFSIAQKVGLSMKSQAEFDCENEQSRLLFILSYDKNMGMGEPNNTVNEPSEWQPVVPESVGEALFKAACGK